MLNNWVIIRSVSAGCFFGILSQIDGNWAVLEDARRLWHWEGAASLSQLAVEGTKSPEHCKFTLPVAKILVADVCEIISCTKAAVKSIQEVPIWKI